MARRTNTSKRSEARIELRVTLDESEQIRNLAEKKHTTVSELLRQLVFAEEERMHLFARAKAKWDES